MAGRFDVAKNYLLSVAERTIGVRAYNENLSGYQAQYDLEGYHPSEEYRNRERGRQRLSSGILGIMQASIPAFVRSLLYYLGPDINPNVYPTRPKDRETILGSLQMVSHTYSSAAVDFGLAYLAIQGSHSPAELIALKLAANAATHVALDVGGAVINGIKNIRPTPSTIAI